MQHTSLSTCILTKDAVQLYTLVAIKVRLQVEEMNIKLPHINGTRPFCFSKNLGHFL